MSSKKRIHITESQLKKLIEEDVFISSADTNTKKAKLKYAYKGGKKNKGNLRSSDMLKTDKMDELNDDTYEIPLKNGLMSYNITSINGTEVMHYFKRIFNKQTTKIKLDEEDYELEMEDGEFRKFMYNFLMKISTVVKYKVNEFKIKNKKLEFANFAVYPVPSSSKFNSEMAIRLQFTSVDGLSPRVINSEILTKDFSKVKQDIKFIRKNSEYYNSPINDNIYANKTHLDNVLTSRNKLNAYKQLKPIVDAINDKLNKLLIKWYQRPADLNGTHFNYLKELARLYEDYSLYKENVLLKKGAEYINQLEDKTSNVYWSKSIDPKKYTKGPSVEKRSEEIFKVLHNYGFTTRKIPIELIRYTTKPLQMKSYSNDVRMGLKDYYSINNDNPELLQKETEQSNETILLVFDDNISGGATLSDICDKLQKLGFKFIIPITFGTMKEQYNLRGLTIDRPNNGFKY